jgi:hypothetical protein
MNSIKNNQKGGFVLGNHDDVIKFLNNSDITIFNSDGGNCYMFLATLQPDIETNLKHMDLNNFNKPVKKILIKVTFLHNDASKPWKHIHIYDQLKVSTFIDNFANEVNIQTNIIFKSFENLLPICPSILSAFTLDIPKGQGAQADEILNLFYRKNRDFRNIYIKLISYDNISLVDKIGIIAMEYAEGYEIVSKHVQKIFYDYNEKKDDKDNLKKIYNRYMYVLLMCMYMVLYIAYLGYNHGDYHMGNILFNPYDTKFMHNIAGRPLFIDFGLTKKLTIEEHKYVVNLIETQQYEKALKYIYNNIPNSAGQFLSIEYKSYGYIAGDYDLIEDKLHFCKFDYLPFSQSNKSINELIKKVHIANLIQLDRNIKEFNDKPAVYRHGLYLPLSITHIGKIFKGLFLEGKPLIVNTSLPKVHKSMMHRISRKLSKPFRYFKEKKAKEENRKQIFETELPFSNLNNLQVYANSNENIARKTTRKTTKQSIRKKSTRKKTSKYTLKLSNPSKKTYNV